MSLKILGLGLLALMITAEIVHNHKDSSGLKVGRPGWERYLPKFNVISIWSDSKTLGKIGGGEKPLYLYSAPAIRRLGLLEEQIYDIIKAYSRKNEFQNQSRVLQRYMKDYEESSVNMMYEDNEATANQNARDYALVANPILANRIIRRFAVEIPEIRSAFEVEKDDSWSMDAAEFLDALKTANPSHMIFPTVAEDYNNSLFSMLRIQQYSNLSTTELAIGQLGQLSTGVGLQARHAFELGSYAGNRTPALFTLAVEWLETALDKFNEEEGMPWSMGTEYKAEIQKQLRETVEKHDAYCSSSSWSTGMEHCFAFLIKGEYGDNRPASLRIKGSDRNNENAIKHRKDFEYSTNTRRNFYNTCSGKNLQTDEEKSRLYCWYETKKHPYLRICPIKIELLNEFPPVMQFHGLLGPRRIETVIKKATPGLKRSLVVNVNDPKASDVSDVRTSVQTWLYDTDSAHAEFLDGINRQIEFVTGLNVRVRRKGKASEAFQVASYRTSHHYDEHMDALKDERRTYENGDRIGTFMFYLTNVEVGGMTGFPTLGTAAKPMAGSAVYWNNLWKNGTADKRTWHGGCPVGHGIKWGNYEQMDTFLRKLRHQIVHPKPMGVKTMQKTMNYIRSISSFHPLTNSKSVCVNL